MNWLILLSLSRPQFYNETMPKFWFGDQVLRKDTQELVVIYGINYSKTEYTNTWVYCIKCNKDYSYITEECLESLKNTKIAKNRYN